MVEDKTERDDAIRMPIIPILGFAILKRVVVPGFNVETTEVVALWHRRNCPTLDPDQAAKVTLQQLRALNTDVNVSFAIGLVAMPDEWEFV